MPRIPSHEHMLSDIHNAGWDDRHPCFAGQPVAQVWLLLQTIRSEDLHIGVEVDDPWQGEEDPRCEADHIDGGVCLARLRADRSCPLPEGHRP